MVDPSAGAWLVYILRCADGSLYTGITTDLSRRRQQHGAGTASRYTRGRLPAELAYQETQASRSAALKRELAIKRLSRPAKEALLRTAAQRGRKGGRRSRDAAADRRSAAKVKGPGVVAGRYGAQRARSGGRS